MKKTILLTAVALMIAAFCVNVSESTGTKTADMVPPITGSPTVQA